MKIKDLRRSELIDATIIAVASRGLSDTSLANIADQAGVSPALVSHYFEGKEDLLAATLLRLVKDLATEIRRRTPATATPYQRLEAIIDSCLESRPLSPGAIVAWRAFWAQIPYYPRLASIQKMINCRFRSNIRAALKELLPADQVEDTYLGFYALIDGFWIRQFVEPKSFGMADAQRVCRRYLDMSIRAANERDSED